jgi:hypothetical protein
MEASGLDLPVLFGLPKRLLPYSQWPMTDRLAVPGVSPIELLALT